MSAVMSAVIRTPVLSAPRYNNARIQDAAQWRTDNAKELERYYRACDEAVRAQGGPVNPRDELGEYDYFVRVQYERAAVTALFARRDL